MKDKNFGSSPVKDAYMRLEIKAPEGCTFRECDICKSPYCFDGRLTNCLWCEINKDQREVEDALLRDLIISSSSEVQTDDNI